ncbi:hypothetical protein [Pseudoxanthomonas sp. CF125]|uniref:hypothetical protein n=1 Tax=Pseudoxanthomonas sp. CF125 TaxID=1855303 RepID=UPI00115FFB3A|nr:hypothetical protein [Pseudoxanthomonas sp. CF125]
MSLPAFVEEAMGEMALGKFIAAYLAPDPIQAARELDALVAAYLVDWVADYRRRESNKTGYISEEQALRDGIAMFTETARKWPIGLARS